MKKIEHIPFKAIDLNKVDISNCGGKPYQTNVIGLDNLLNDGIVLPSRLNNNEEKRKADGIVILIKGKPGTGKTTLALQLATGLTNSFITGNKTGAENNNQISLSNSKFYSIEQGKAELEDKLLDIEISRILYDAKNEKNENKIANGLARLERFFNLENRESAEIVQRFVFSEKVDNQETTLWNLNLIKQMKYSCIENKIQCEVPAFTIPRIELLPDPISKEEAEECSKIIYSCLREYITDKFIRDKCNLISDKIKDSSNVLKEIINKHVQDQVTLNGGPICQEILKAKIFPAIVENEIYDFVKQLEFEKQTVSELAAKAFESQSISADMVKSLTSLQDIDCQELAKKITSKLGPRFSSKIETVFNVSMHSGEPQNSTSNDKVYSKSPVQYFLDYITDITDSGNTLYPCIVFDGLNILNEQEKRMINLHHVVQVLREKAFFSIIVFDGIDQDDRAQDYLSDMIIELRGEEKELNYFMHDLRIHKARYQPAAVGWHQYKIRDFGLLAFKSLHFQSHRANYMDSRLMQSFIIPQLKEKRNEDPNSKEDGFFNIEKILYKPKPGSFTVILGPRATFKTKLCLSFLYGKVETTKGREEGDSLLISLVDNLGVLENSCSCQFQQAFDSPNCLREKCTNKFYIFHIRPGIISPEEFFYYLQRRIDEHKSRTNKEITRLAFWDLTQIDYRFPMFLNNPMFLSTLVEFGKERDIAMCIMGAGNSKLTPSASAIADNVIFCWRDTLKRDSSSKKDHPDNDSKDAFDFLSSNLPGKKKDDRFCDEYLALYVDRCQGLLGGEGRELTYLPIIKERDKQHIYLNCPVKLKHATSRYTIINNQVYQRNESDNKKLLEKPFEFRLSESNIIKVEDIDLFLDTKKMTHKIADLQGIGKVN